MSSLFPPAPEPKSELQRYRMLSENAGVRVSPLCLGAMSIGDNWKAFMGSMDKDQSFKLLDAYAEQGGNFIDIANNYHNEQSEKWVGDWMAKRGNRDRMFVATKYTTDYRSYELGQGNAVNYCGNHKKSMFVSVKDSLKKLQTDYIDLLYLHWWDHTTSIPEIMDALHILVQQGKVLYLGISDTPAWIVSAMNEYAKAHGKTPISVYQGKWSIMLRDLERDIIPMARYYGMAICPWGVIGGGHFQSKKQLEERKKSNEGVRGGNRGGELTEDEVKISAALEKVAGEHGIESLSAIAIAYVMSKAPYVFPLIGGRKIEHLNDNIQALKIKLTDKQVEYLESIMSFDPGFPNTMIGPDPRTTGKATGLAAYSAQYAFVQRTKPIDHA